MAVGAASQFRLDMIAAVSARLQAQGHNLDGSQLGALVDDIETTINTDSAFAIAQSASDMGIFSDPPVSGQ
jgi:hypothetical protein